jgi:quercetin dioxygenase-like cupin family protein
VLLSIKTPSEDTSFLNVTIDNALFGQKTGVALIFDANIPHSGHNNTNEWWIALVIVVDKSYWGNK